MPWHFNKLWLTAVIKQISSGPFLLSPRGVFLVIEEYCLSLGEDVFLLSLDTACCYSAHLSASVWPSRGREKRPQKREQQPCDIFGWCSRDSDFRHSWEKKRGYVLWEEEMTPFPTQNFQTNWKRLQARHLAMSQVPWGSQTTCPKALLGSFSSLICLRFLKEKSHYGGKHKDWVGASQ